MDVILCENNCVSFTAHCREWALLSFQDVCLDVCRSRHCCCDDWTVGRASVTSAVYIAAIVTPTLIGCRRRHRLIIAWIHGCDWLALSLTIPWLPSQRPRLLFLPLRMWRIVPYDLFTFKMTYYSAVCVILFFNLLLGTVFIGPPCSIDRISACGW